MVRFEEKQLVIKPIITAAFWENKKIPYEKIEKIEVTKESVIFSMKSGKEIKVNDPGIAAFYTEFGDMLRDYKIPFKTSLDNTGYDSIETVRERAAKTKETALSYANRSIKEKLGPEYELTAEIVERIIGTTLEFTLLKNGVTFEEANTVDSIDDIPLVDDMDIAFLSEWDPDSDRGTYYVVEEANDTNACEDYVQKCILDDLYSLKFARE